MRIIGWLLLIWLLPQTVRADDASARVLFEAGVAAAASQRWSEAVRLFEASLAQKDRPACRYNLVVAYRELQQPLEVARHALAFLAAIEARSHADEAVEVRSLLEQATRELAVLQLQNLPLGVQMKIDDAQPEVADGSRIYVLPGLRRLALWLDNHELESLEIVLSAGALQPWPRVRALRENTASNAQLRGVPASAAEGARPSMPARAPIARPAESKVEVSSWRVKKQAARALGVAGGLLGLGALGCYAYSLHRANVLEDWDPARAGYRLVADQYGRIKNSAMALGLSGGALMAAGTALIVHKPRAALAVSVTSLLLGLSVGALGIVFLVRRPALLVDGTDIERPTRAAGGLLMGLALPLLGFGTRVQWMYWHAD